MQKIYSEHLDYFFAIICERTIFPVWFFFRT